MNPIPKLRNFQPSMRIEVVWMVALLGLVCILVWPGMHAPLISDDTLQSKYDGLLTSWKDCFGRDAFGLFRPTKNFIFHALRGKSEFVWHATSLASYLCATLALYVLLRRLLGSFLWATIAVTLWATCPTQVSTAVWTSCANISLAVAFSCVCVALHDHSQEKPGRNIGISILTGLCLFLALCSYETAVATPVFCVLVDCLRKRPLFYRTAIARYTMLAIITVFYLMLRMHLGSTHSEHDSNLAFFPDTQPWQLSVSAPWFLWRHLSMWLMPAGRIEVWGTYLWGLSTSLWALAAAWALLFLIIATVLFTRKRQPWVAFGLLWYLAASFPSSNLVPIWAGPIEDYYLVFPSIGLAIALVGCAKSLAEWSRRERADGESSQKVVGGAILLVGGCWRLMCLPLFWLQAELWNRPAELYLREDLTRSHQFQLQSAAASEFLNMGQYKEAGELAGKAHATAPWFPSANMVLGEVALHNADYDLARKHYQQALASAPKYTDLGEFCILQMARASKEAGEKSEIVRETLLPLLNNPRSPHHLAAIHLQIDCYKAAGQIDDARRATKKAIQIHPGISEFADILAEIDKIPPLSATPSKPLK